MERLEDEKSPKKLKFLFKRNSMNKASNKEG